MTGKNGSPWQAAAETAASNQQPPREYKSARRLYLVHNRDDQERAARLPQSRAAGRRGILDRTLQAQLGNMLRTIFSDVAEVPNPERFVKLLEALEAREKNP
jgi:hypothetical protein